MKLTESQLRNIIREVIAECYGWPVEHEREVYQGSKGRVKVHGKDPRNPNLRLPKGPNSRTGLKESFQRITPRELVAWREGNYEDIREEVNYDPCDKCDQMFPALSLNKDGDDKYVCNTCYDKDVK